MSFLPEDYETPKASSSYMKFQEGENKFRILSQPIIGWLDWMNKKPVRFRQKDKPKVSFEPGKEAKHFWAMVVWNYNEEKIQILEITQSSIQKALQALSKDVDWGSPYFYDIKVAKTGNGKETKYVVNPAPRKPLEKKIRSAFEVRPCNIEALYDGKDPFSLEWSSFTKGIFSMEDIKMPVQQEKIA